MITDIPVAFAAGSTEPVGIVVFAGTGAGAAVINAGEIERRADANGYLIGDEGSAVWIGREAVRAVMRAYDGRGRATLLAETVPRALLGEAAGPLLAGLDPGIAAADGAPTAGRTWSGPGLPQAIIKKVYAEQPASIGGVARLVSVGGGGGRPGGSRHRRGGRRAPAGRRRRGTPRAGRPARRTRSLVSWSPDPCSRAGRSPTAYAPAWPSGSASIPSRPATERWAPRAWPYTASTARWRSGRGTAG